MSLSRPRGALLAMSLAAVLGTGALAPAHAADTGSISGTVTSRTTGAASPFADAYVSLDRQYDDDADRFDYDVAFAFTDASGGFTLPSLPDGHYRLQVQPPSPTNPSLGDLGDEFYDDSWNDTGATLIEVANGAAVSMPSPIELRPIGRIAGCVTNEQGQPVQGSVYVTDVDGLGGASASTDAAGCYDTLLSTRAANVIPGTYKVDFMASGQDIGDPVCRWEEKPAPVTAGQTTTVDFHLVERPTVVFTVLGANGEPQAYAPAGFRMRDAGEDWRAPQYGPITTDGQGRLLITDNADEFKLWFGPEDGGTEAASTSLTPTPSPTPSRCTSPATLPATAPTPSSWAPRRASRRPRRSSRATHRWARPSPWMRGTGRLQA